MSDRVDRSGWCIEFFVEPDPTHAWKIAHEGYWIAYDTHQERAWVSYGDFHLSLKAIRAYQQDRPGRVWRLRSNDDPPRLVIVR